MDKGRFGRRPMLDLRDHRCSRMAEGEKVGRNDGLADLRPREGKPLHRALKNAVDHPENQGTAPAEHQPAEEKFFPVFFHHSPNLSFTVRRFLRDT